MPAIFCLTAIVWGPDQASPVLAQGTAELLEELAGSAIDGFQAEVRRRLGDLYTVTDAHKATTYALPGTDPDQPDQPGQDAMHWTPPTG